jgi:hypothetical protein
LLISTLGTTLLMVRFLYLMGRPQAAHAPASPWLALPWLLLLGAILWWPFASAYAFPSPTAGWPLLAAVLAALLIARWRPGPLVALTGRIPPGDLLQPVSRGFHGLRRRLEGLPGSRRPAPAPGAGFGLADLRRSVAQPPGMEQTLGLWPVTGSLVLGLGMVLMLLFWTAP